MAQLLWTAENHPIDRQLNNMGWTSNATWKVHAISGSNAKKCFRVQTGGAITLRAVFDEEQVLPLNQQVLVVADFTATEGGSTALNLKASAFGAKSANNFFNFEFNLVESTNAVTIVKPSSNLTYTKEVAPTGITGVNGIAMRIQMVGTTLKAKMWAAPVGSLEANEPAAWNYEANYTGVALTAADSLPGMQDNLSTANSKMTSIGIGTEGEAAPFQTGSQSVAQPTTLTATPTSNSAALDWVQP